MRKFLLVILLSAFFMGGYYLGRQPGSPNVFAWAKKAYAWSSAQMNSEKPSAALIKQSGDDPQDAAESGISVKIGGKVYTLGK